MSESARPPSMVPPSGIGGHGTRDPSEAHETVVAGDGTRLFLRRMPRRSDAIEGSSAGSESIPGTSPGGIRAIFCDGILCDGFIWKYLWNDLAGVCDVAHWHYRGHGRSAAPVDASLVDIPSHARDLAAVRKHLGEPPVVLVGHSMGTQVVLENAHLFPEKVKGLVLLCGSYGKITHSFRGMPILDMILPKVMDIVDKQPELVRAIWSRLPPEMAFKAALLARDVDPASIRREDMLPYLKHMTHVDFPMFLKMLRAAGEHSAEDWLAQLDVPVLVVAGEKDTFTPASLSEFMAEQIPNAELLMVKGGTHVAPLEQPELVGAAIKAFVERVAAT